MYASDASDTHTHRHTNRQTDTHTNRPSHWSSNASFCFRTRVMRSGQGHGRKINPKNQMTASRDAATGRLVCWNGDDCPWHARGTCLFVDEQTFELCACVRRLAAFVMWHRPSGSAQCIATTESELAEHSGENFGDGARPRGFAQHNATTLSDIAASPDGAAKSIDEVRLLGIAKYSAKA